MSLPEDEYVGHPTELVPEELCYVRLIDANNIEFCSTTDYPGCRFKYSIDGEHGAVIMFNKFRAVFQERGIPSRLVFNNVLINRTHIISETPLEDSIRVVFNSMRDGVGVDIYYPPGDHVVDSV